MVEPTGCLIALEGTEGAGKSSQLRLASEALTREGWPIRVTAEPGGTALGEQLRTLLLHRRETTPTALTELFLYLADRAQHIAEVIEPAVAAGAVVLTDRFYASTLSYQGFGRGLDIDTVTRVDAWARSGVTPRLTVLLDCPVQIGLQRAQRHDRFHAEAEAFHERVRQGFLTLAAADPEGWRVIDATQSEATVHTQVVAAIRNCLRSG